MSGREFLISNLLGNRLFFACGGMLTCVMVAEVKEKEDILQCDKIRRC